MTKISLRTSLLALSIFATLNLCLASRARCQTLLNGNFDTETTAGEYTTPQDYTSYGPTYNNGWLPVDGNSPTGASGDDVFVNVNDAGNVNGLSQNCGGSISIGATYTYTLGIGVFQDQAAFTAGSGTLLLGYFTGAGFTQIGTGTVFNATSLTTTLQNISVSYTALAGDPGIGDNLVVGLQENGNDAGGGGSPSFAIDNGALSVAAVPEPSALALLGMGGAALSLIAWRRRLGA